jgi:hypothetical protein
LPSVVGENLNEGKQIFGVLCGTSKRILCERVKHSGKSTNYTLLHSTQQTKEEHNAMKTESLPADNSHCRVRQVHYYPYKITSDHPIQVARPQDLPPDKPSSRPITREFKSPYSHTTDSNSSVQGTESCLKAISPSTLPTHLIVTMRPLDPQIQQAYFGQAVRL